MRNKLDIKQARENAKNLKEFLLKQQAKKLFFGSVKNEKYRDNFIKKLETYKVVDKREEGFYCSYCKSTNKTPSAYSSTNKVIFPLQVENEIWIINQHYDGCRGWN
jgi:hypothetical protein